MDFSSLTKKQVKDLIALQFWRMGDLRFKFKPVQLEMYEDIEESKTFKHVIQCSRRLGKTFFLCTIATEKCLQKPYTMVRYAAPTHKSLKKFIIPIMRKVLEDCPKDLQPEFIKSDGVFLFKNGSEIHLAGVNNDNSDSLRGTHADLFIIDEAGYIDDLLYLINDVALPQFLDPDGKVVEGRKLLISGSPARTPAHEFASVCRDALARGILSHYDIYRAGYPQHVLNMIIEECGGIESTTWKREYLALDVVDSNYALIPEWRPEYAEEPLIDERFQFYHKYVGLDIGVRDLTVALFAHYDFVKATLYIHDEVVLSGPEMTTERLALEVRKTEEKVFGKDVHGNPVRPHKRVSDIDLLLLNDMRALHKLYFSPTDKGRLEEMVNEVRIWVNQGRVRVSKNCKQLLGSLAYGVWNESRTEFERIPEYGHFDALAALMYLIRNVDQNINPIPRTFGKDLENTFFPDDDKNSNRDKLKKAFGGK